MPNETPLQVLDARTPQGWAVYNQASQYVVGGERGLMVNKRTGQVQFQTPRGLILNSTLRKDEWEELDRQIVEASVPPLNIVSTLERRGLIRRFGSLGTLAAQYNQVSEMTQANVSMRGHASGEKDLVDFNLVSIPVPVIFKEFELDERLLQSSRMLGDGLDFTNARAASRVVAEKIEELTVDGDAGINLNGAVLQGVTNQANINTDTATNYGGGDWGTIENVEKTIAGMIAAAKVDGYYGPYGIWAATTQYNQAALVSFTDGSGETPRDRVLRMPMVDFFEESPQLADGEILLVTLVADVIQIGYVNGYWPMVNLEWASGDSLLNSFKVMSVFTPIVKSDYSGKSGLVLSTGA